MPMRRSDRAIPAREDILRVLDSCTVMHLGLCREGEPYVVPLNFGWEEINGQLFIYFHGAGAGKKQDWIAGGANCFVTFTGNCAIVPGPDACDWSACYASVMVSGFVRPLNDEGLKQHGLDLVMRHCGFEGQPHYQLSSLQATRVWQIKALEVTGKQRNA
jgi:nitroimidazol reductase NimA-like FMN-containing flavoprotein (pyridoxamine 5'-phosphate oxidase superfamily)